MTKVDISGVTQLVMLRRALLSHTRTAVTCQLWLYGANLTDGQVIPAFQTRTAGERCSVSPDASLSTVRRASARPNGALGLGRKPQTHDESCSDKLNRTLGPLVE